MTRDRRGVRGVLELPVTRERARIDLAKSGVDIRPVRRGEHYARTDAGELVGPFETADDARAAASADDRYARRTAAMVRAWDAALGEGRH